MCGVMCSNNNFAKRRLILFAGRARFLSKVESTKKMSSTSYKAQYKISNAYSSWMTAGTYGNFNDALALRKKDWRYCGED
ncbi:hypothetical protein PHIN11_10870 [Polynucleobacter sp. HIN11]|nr:hypothetical protein PHIN11_10870 [Polynucleobacter sp. HIN11]